MFIYSNALKNLWRNRGRNILVCVILLIVMTVTTVALAINSMSNAIIEGFTEGFGVEATITTDWEYAQANSVTERVELPDGGFMEMQSFDVHEITMEEHMYYADSKYLKGVLFSAYSDFVAPDLEKYPDGIMDWHQHAELRGITRDSEWGGRGMDDETWFTMWDAKRGTIGQIHGYSDATLLSALLSGERELEQGRMFENLNETIICARLAEHNNLRIGDVITISGTSGTYDTTYHELVIVGIFRYVRGEADQFTIQLWLPIWNSILVSLETLNDLGFRHVFPTGATYFINDPDSIEPFLNELREKGLHESFMLEYDIESYLAIVEPVENMSGIAATFGIVILITGAVILVFLSVINIRERKYEVGVLRAVGMKKHRLARGMAYESLSLVTLSTLLGLPLGVALAKPIADILLTSSDSIEFALTFNIGLLSLILLVAVILGIISSLIGIFYITRYEPMKILQERN